jgi:hypothetical protein
MGGGGGVVETRKVAGRIGRISLRLLVSLELAFYFKAHNLVCTRFVTACVFAILIPSCTFLMTYSHQFSFNDK